MELQINEPLETESPDLMLLPDLMIANVATEVNLDCPRVVLVSGCCQSTGMGRCNGLSEMFLLKYEQ